MNHPTLKEFTLVEQLEYVNFYSNPARDIFIAEHKESTTVSAEIAKESIDLIAKYKNGNSIYAITDASAKLLKFTTEAKNYYRDHVIDGGIILNAIVVKDVALKIVANVYARFDRPKIRTRVFTSLTEALSWIEEAK